MIRKRKAARYRIVIITIRISNCVLFSIVEIKGTAARKVSGWLRNCGLRNLEGPRLAPRDEQPKRIYVVHK
jgi:hypothetical protein